MGSSDGNGGAAQGAMQTSLANQGLAANQINAGVTGLNNQANMLNAPTSATGGGIASAIDASMPGYTSGLSTALGSGGNMSSQTGVNQNQLGQQFTNYASNAGGTNLSQASPGLNSFYQGEMNSAANPALTGFYQGQMGSQANPALTGFYGNEMSQGIGQPQMLNAQNQLQQQFAQANATSAAHAGPGTNQAATNQANQNALLTASGNLAGSLAGQNQAAMQQGASGLNTTQQQQIQQQQLGASGLANTQQQQQQLQQQGATGQAGTASNLDAQTMNMLQQALTSGQGINTSQLNNLISVLGLGSGTLNQGLSAAQQGAADTGAGMSAEGGLFSGYGGQAQNFGTQAAQNAQNSGFGGILGSIGGLLSPIKL